MEMFKNNTRGAPPNWDYILEGEPFVAQASSAGERSRNPLYQCTSWRCLEKLQLASLNFF